MSIGITAAGLTTAAPFITTGVTSALGLGSARIQSGAAGKSAQIQSDAAIRAAELKRQTAADQLDYVRNQERMDRGTARWADRQNYELSKAEGLNTFNQLGDTAVNRRAELVSTGLSRDKRYRENQIQYNTMRRLMGMPDKALSTYVAPDELRLTAPVLPEYVEDPTQYTVDDDVDPLTNARRRV